MKIQITGIQGVRDMIKAQSAEIIKREKEAITNGLVERLKDATPVRTGYAKSRWEVKDGNIVNDAPYIDDLNAGSSQQAPKFFIEKTVLATPSVVPNGTIVTKIDNSPA